MQDNLRPNTTTIVGSPIDADFAAFRDVDLRSLAVILVLTGELDVLELVQPPRLWAWQASVSLAHPPQKPHAVLAPVPHQPHSQYC